MTGQLFTAEPLTEGRPGWCLAGEIDLASRDELAGVLDKVTGEQCDANGLTHFELADLKFIDLAGTESLIRTAQRVYRASGTRLALHHPPYPLRRVAALLLDDLDFDEDGTLTLPSANRTVDEPTGRQAPNGIA